MLQYHKWVIHIGTIIILISFIFAFLNRKVSNIPRYLQLFYICPFFVLLLSLNTIACLWINHYPARIGIFMEKVLSYIDFIFWTVFFYSLNKHHSTKHWNYIFAVFILAFTPSLFINSYEKFPYVSLAVLNFGKCLYCLFYFHDLFKILPKIVLKKEPEFWIIIGLFFYTTVTIPIYVTTTYLSNNMDVRLMLFSFTNISIMIMHLLFIKGNLCVVKRVKDGI